MDPDLQSPNLPGRFLNRRQWLGLMGTAAAVLLTGCGPGERAPWLRGLLPRRTPSVASFPPCVVRPEQTEGPYFVDERLNRSDIRNDPSDGSVKEGAPLQLTLRVHEIRGKECAPLPGAMVDIWHCDAKGVYSDVRDRALFDTRGKKFLRGYLTTDANGAVQFETIYPGWYPGRTVHIHFKIRTSPEARRGYEFTSQIYFDDALTDRVLAHAPYLPAGRGRIRNAGDGIFQDGGEKLLLPVTQQGDGYAGTFDIGLLLG
ncbi:MAG: intradiol ring-cleavage dioxygenase [Nitrospirae bacterium]|nr:intradiol ring-cleavage dioxygenase [Nitrospirota bacterium]